ncbi:DUF4376 domain-containing protein [Pseudazoarcus pumilus]|uniref:DUF4376 domain-containing protein n=1 Tax=Pseudazoarcus pumilus TaxID=2067960 RepID=A0A2I6S9D3_9RHOO|nr:DUF4376 domain-containing protein [Pseudazoarcus pumilus]AUN95867.1 hypothetical protein C0099_13565 [Pseudazoarcus pumilus]
MYRLHPKRGVILLSTGKHIPPHRSDARWRAYQKWVKDGGVPEAADVDLEPLERLHDRTRSRINIERDRREQGGFPFGGKIIDSNVASAIRIAGAASAAQASLARGQPFTVAWTCADNTVLTLDAAGVIGMLAALATHSDALHQHARSLKAQADAMLDTGNRVGLENFPIDAGWPGEGDVP